MKKIFLNTLMIAISAAIFLNSCTKSDFDNNFYNPEKSVTADIPRLYASMFAHEKVMPRYWNLYTFHIPVLGTYSQESGYTQGKGIYEQPTNYTSDRWNYFFTHDIAIFREIEKYYNALSTDDEKAGFKIFIETARIFLYDQATQMVDLFGDIPFKEAGSLNAKGTMSLAAYDKQQDIYTQALTDLKGISDFLASGTIADFYASQFSSYDYVNGGDRLKWRKYCNSLMLRLAMRISYKDEATAKGIVQSILSNPTAYPIIETYEESAEILANSPTSSLLPADKNEVRNGFGVNPFAPGKMINDIMLPTHDPRLPLYFTRNESGTYEGIANTLTEAEVTSGVAANRFSRWDSTTFTENYILPGILITAAETQFLKAEAFERWGGGDAKASYENGIRQSILYWYNIHKTSVYTGGPLEPAPTNVQINDYIADPAIAYGTDNLNKIATQKWIDFNILGANQAWAEWRRTKLPALSFPNDPGSSISPNVPSRLLYPTSERTLNASNFEAVKANDKIDVKIFWDTK